MTPLVLVGLGGMFVTFCYAIVTAPRWCFGSVCRHLTWKLRDDYVDDLLAERLPQGDPAVESFRTRLEFLVRRHRPVDVFDVFLAEREVGRLPPTAVAELHKSPAADDLSDEQRELLRGYQQRCIKLFAASVLTSSWVGAPVVLWIILRNRPRTANEVVEQAADTQLGRRASRIAPMLPLGIRPKVSTVQAMG